MNWPPRSRCSLPPEGRVNAFGRPGGTDMPTTELAALLAYTTAMAFTPGPNTTLSAAMGANHGLAHALPFVLAVPFGWCLLLAASATGLGTLVHAVPAVGAALRRWLAHRDRLTWFNRTMAAVLAATALWVLAS